MVKSFSRDRAYPTKVFLWQLWSFPWLRACAQGIINHPNFNTDPSYDFFYRYNLLLGYGVHHCCAHWSAHIRKGHTCGVRLAQQKRNWNICFFWNKDFHPFWGELVSQNAWKLFIVFFKNILPFMRNQRGQIPRWYSFLIPIIISQTLRWS